MHRRNSYTHFLAGFPTQNHVWTASKRSQEIIGAVQVFCNQWPISDVHTGGMKFSPIVVAIGEVFMIGKASSVHTYGAAIFAGGITTGLKAA